MASSTITLIPSGAREVVDKDRANEIVEEWKAQVEGAGDSVVEKIVLTNKSYTSDGSKIIKDFLVENNLVGSVKVADVSDIIASRMEDEGLEVLKVICDAFLNAELVEVDLSDNAMGSKGISACTSVLSGQASSLERLSLCNNGLSGASMSEVADLLCEKIDGSGQSIASRLTKIHFYNNMSGDEGCTAFSRILKQCSLKLNDVRFSGTRAGRPGSLRVAQAMNDLGDSVQNISRWDLADNTFSGDGAKALASALTRCQNLKYLNLRDCSLGDEGTQSICEALIKAGCSLNVLDLSGNDITKSGAKFVAQLIGHISGSLELLFMEENEISSRGVVSIARSFTSCSSLREVKLGMNECGNIGGNSLCAVAGKMKSLTKIELDNNMFSEDVVEKLRESYGNLLVDMEDNDDEEDPDADLSEEESEHDEGNESVASEESDASALEKTRSCISYMISRWSVKS